MVIVPALSPQDVSPLAAPEETTTLYSHPSRLDSAVCWGLPITICITYLRICVQETIEEPKGSGFVSTHPEKTASIKTEGRRTLCETTLSRLKVNASQRQRRERAISMETIKTQAIPNIYPHCYLITIWRTTNKPYLTL